MALVKDFVLILALFNIFVGDIGNGIECSLIRFMDDTKLSAAVDAQEKRNGIQRDLDGLESLANENLKKFNKAKCQGPDLSWGNSKQKYRLGGKLPLGKEYGGVG